eukprot:GILK01010731.1.p1 GENE.GILK01010731.1~~GILK01010731.1.p1  ORF type:complete len:1274 (+),score=348.87 GILK01010731.1:349-3822(+)
MDDMFLSKIERLKAEHARHLETIENLYFENKKSKQAAYDDSIINQNRQSSQPDRWAHDSKSSPSRPRSAGGSRVRTAPVVFGKHWKADHSRTGVRSSLWGPNYQQQLKEWEQKWERYRKEKQERAELRRSLQLGADRSKSHLGSQSPNRRQDPDSRSERQRRKDRDLDELRRSTQLESRYYSDHSSDEDAEYRGREKDRKIDKRQSRSLLESHEPTPLETYSVFLTEKDISNLKKAFERIDADKSGTVSTVELLTAFLDDNELQKLLNLNASSSSDQKLIHFYEVLDKIDENKSADISWPEFLAYFERSDQVGSAKNRRPDHAEDWEHRKGDLKETSNRNKPKFLDEAKATSTRKARFLDEGSATVTRPLHSNEEEDEDSYTFLRPKNASGSRAGSGPSSHDTFEDEFTDRGAHRRRDETESKKQRLGKQLFSGAASDGEAVDTPVHKRSVNEFAYAFSEQQIGAFKTLFEHLDVDHGGTVSVTELLSGLDSVDIKELLDLTEKEAPKMVLEFQQVFKEIDEDASDSITWDEFLGYLERGGGNAGKRGVKLDSVQSSQDVAAKSKWRAEPMMELIPSQVNVLRKCFEKLVTEKERSVDKLKLVSALRADARVNDLLGLPAGAKVRDSISNDFENVLRKIERDATVVSVSWPQFMSFFRIADLAEDFTVQRPATADKAPSKREVDFDSKKLEKLRSQDKTRGTKDQFLAGDSHDDKRARSEAKRRQEEEEQAHRFDEERYMAALLAVYKQVDRQRIGTVRTDQLITAIRADKRLSLMMGVKVKKDESGIESLDQVLNDLEDVGPDYVSFDQFNEFIHKPIHRRLKSVDGRRQATDTKPQENRAERVERSTHKQDQYDLPVSIMMKLRNIFDSSPKENASTGTVKSQTLVLAIRTDSTTEDHLLVQARLRSDGSARYDTLSDVLDEVLKTAPKFITWNDFLHYFNRPKVQSTKKVVHIDDESTHELKSSIHKDHGAPSQAVGKELSSRFKPGPMDEERKPSRSGVGSSQRASRESDAVANSRYGGYDALKTVTADRKPKATVPTAEDDVRESHHPQSRRGIDNEHRVKQTSPAVLNVDEEFRRSAQEYERDTRLKTYHSPVKKSGAFSDDELDSYEESEHVNQTRRHPYLHNEEEEDVYARYEKKRIFQRPDSTRPSQR